MNLDGQVVEMVTCPPSLRWRVIQGTDLSTTTNAEGAFEFRGVPEGMWTLQVARPGWETTTYTVEVVDGEISTAKLWIRTRTTAGTRPSASTDGNERK